MTRFAVVSCLCLALFAAGVYADGEKEKIVGGQAADIADFPYQVSLRFKGKHFCGGIIISDKHILTAAHCVKAIVYRLLPYITVVAGSSMSTGSSGKAYRVKKIVVHSGWTDKRDAAYVNDIAVVTLTEDIDFNGKTKKADLPSADVVLGERAVVTGWGINRYPSSAAVMRLQKADMKLIPNEECTRIVPSSIYHGQVCAYQKKGVGACSGDSGGPLAVGNTVVGIVSWVYPCGKGKPDVYTKVYHYLDWIERAIRD